MSLILEALKKSEANRRLGETPDLATPFATRPPRRSPLPLLLVLIALASVAGWWLLRAPPASDGTGMATAQGGAKAAKPAPAAAAQAAAPTTPVVRTPAAVADANALPPEQKLGGGFIATPKPWAPTKNKAETATASAPPKPETAALSAPQPAPGAVVAGGTGQKKPEPAASANPAAPPAPGSVVAGGTGPKKSEPAGMTAPPAPGAIVASGTGQKKPEPVPAANAPAQPAAGSVIAGGTGQKKPEPAPAANAPAQPAAGSVIAGGVGQKKTDSPADAKNAATDASPPPSAPPYNELSFATRKDLPALKLSMHVYAAEPPQRFVILNNARLGEGDKQDDLAVREIRPDGIVLEFRGQRFFYPRDGI